LPNLAHMKDAIFVAGLLRCPGCAIRRGHRSFPPHEGRGGGAMCTRLTVLAATAVLAMMVAMAGTAWATTSGGTDGKATGQGKGPANACGAFVAQAAHGKSAHAKDLDRLAQKLDQRGCPPPPPCLATNSCNNAPPPELGAEASCEGVPGTCVYVSSGEIILYGALAAGKSTAGPDFFDCPDAQPWLWSWSTSTSSSAVWLLTADNSGGDTPNALWYSAANAATFDNNWFQMALACSDVQTPNA